MKLRFGTVAFAALAAGTAFGQTVLFVDRDADPGGNGTTWQDAYQDLADALDARAGVFGTVEIWIAEGVYAPDRGTGDPTLSYGLTGWTALFGGFAGHESDRGQADPGAHPVVLSGDLAGDDGPGFSNREDNSNQVAVASDITGPIRIDGVVFRGGEGREDSQAGALRLGGEYGTQAALLLLRCVFEETRGFNAVGSYRAPVVIEGCTVRSNECRGAAVHLAQMRSGAVVGSTFERNRGGRGGGLYLYNSRSTIPVVACRFIGNHAAGLGGAMYDAPAGRQAQAEVVGSVFIGNTSDEGCGAIETMADMRVESCTFVGNAAPALSLGGTTFDMRNCVIWAHGEEPIVDTEWNELSHCVIPGGWVGEGNIDADPRFMDPVGPDGIPWTGDEDLRVRLGSPAVDAGDPIGLPPDEFDLDGDGDRGEPLPIDLAGAQRVVDDPCTDAGSRALDIGAFERQPSYCAPDINMDCALDTRDVVTYLTRWAAGDDEADFDGDGTVSTADVNSFLDAWAGGC